MKYNYFKHTFDFFFATFLLLLLLPLLLITAILIKLESEGPIFFLQKRLGKNGKEFIIYKFRSMSLGAEKGGVYEAKNDSRVTKVGRFIRKFSIDELPQLFNILKGEMSVIGPRPTLTYHPWPFEEYTSLQRKRFNQRPGVTGWAQINGRKDVMWDDRIKLDIFYVENLSFFLDLKIFFITIYKVLLMKDNYNSTKSTVKSI